MSKTQGRQRVRLRESSKNIEALQKGRRKSVKNAPRKSNGKIIQGYAYKELLEGHRERTPSIVVAHQGSRSPMFVVQPNLAKRIVKLIRKGYPYTTVCRAVGVTPKTFKEWLEKGKSGVNHDYIKFFEDVAKAEAYAEMRTLNMLRKHEKSDWRVSAWQLERRWPEHWSKIDRITADLNVNSNAVTDAKEDLSKSIAKDEAARELARRLIDDTDFSYPALQNPAVEDA